MAYLLVRGDARRLPIADGSVHCVVTSPPYFSLRDYGTGRWEGGEPECDHQAPNGQGETGQRADRTFTANKPYRSLCGKCGARRVDAQLGLEPTPDEYVAAMVGVFREVWRVLHPSGTCFINIGDSYSSGDRTSQCEPSDNTGRAKQHNGGGRRPPVTPGLKPKDLCMVPARLALALQADGWYLRSEIIWAKPNPMPESVTDRPTKSHEQVYLLSKQERYYYDAEAVREPHKDAKVIDGVYHGSGANRPGYKPNNQGFAGGSGLVMKDREYNPAGRNLRSVWTIATESFPGSHFATFPRALVSPCIRAGTSERGCCPRCFSPWTREVEREVITNGRGRDHIAGGDRTIGQGWEGVPRASLRTSTLGWHASCPHELDPVPCTVLDPFCGSGTSLVVAEALGRRGIGVELSAEYLAIARRRLDHPHAAVPRPGRVEHHPLFGDAL